jgi:hypothetical protein
MKFFIAEFQADGLSKEDVAQALLNLADQVTHAETDAEIGIQYVGWSGAAIDTAGYFVRPKLTKIVLQPPRSPKPRPLTAAPSQPKEAK